MIADPEPQSSAVCQAKPPLTLVKFQALTRSRRTSLDWTVQFCFDTIETAGGQAYWKLVNRAIVFEGNVRVELLTLLRFQSPTPSQVGPLVF